MSNALAIATATATLSQLIAAALDGAHVAGATVTALRPDAPSGLPNPGVNVFLYQATPNAALRNPDLPTRGPDGRLLRRPQVALDLHYLLSFYGDDTKLEQQRLLGAVAIGLHAQAVLTRDAIRHVQTTVPFLAGADLADQSELVRLAPVNFSLEDLSKLWSFLLKIDYVLSAAYVASVVLIETDDAVPPPALPVLAAKLYALPFAQPVIATIADAAGGPIGPDSQIALTGRNLSVPGRTAAVLIGGQSITPLTASATRLTAALPAGLAAGAESAQVAHALLLGVPPVAHAQGVLSAAASFVLHPLIRASGSPPVYAVAVQTLPGPPPVRQVTVGVRPTARAGQRALLELLPSGLAGAHLVDGGVLAADTDTLAFVLPAIPPGTYLVRVRVDGAESPFALDAAGTPVAPVLTL